MDRRSFIKMCSLAGMGVVVSGLDSNREAWAGTQRCYVMVNAGGGWDPTLVCDPKGGNVEAGTGINPEFSASEIGVAGNLSYAPVANNKAFFDRFSDQLLVINGIDTQTNGHDTGRRSSASGDLKDGFPAFAALAAATLAEGQAMAFITNGGYDETAGVVGATRFGDLGAIEALIYPNRENPPDDESATFFTNQTWKTIQQSRKARLDRQRQEQRLPRIRNGQDLLYTSRLNTGGLKDLLQWLPDDLGQGLARQANIGLAAYKAGLTTSINMSLGGFDTHSNHFQNHEPRVAQLLDGVMALMDRAEELDIVDEVVVCINSDFGRTPSINTGNGKDHWAVGSMMLMGPGIAGNRVVGGTDDGQNYRNVDANTLLPVDSGGVTLRNSHIHAELRKNAGIADHPNLTSFKLANEEELSILTG